MDISLVELMEEARQAAGRAYAPYSRFRVGAALLLADGTVVTGGNVENSSYGLSICAERAAVCRAVSRYGQIRIAAVAVTNLNGAASPPCGACRQVLSEFAAGTTPMVFAGENGPVETTLAALLPFGFRLGSG